MSRTLVIGDIHGSAKALEQVLERANVTDEDTIIQLGDVADGWSETSKCVDILLGLPNLISIRGNHDVWVYDWFKLGLQPYIWTQQGGQATIDSYIRTRKLTDSYHKDFWNNQVDWYIDDQDRLFIHAGWAYAHTPEEWHVSSITERRKFELQAGTLIGGVGSAVGSIAKECHWDRDLLMGARSANVGKNGRFKALEQFKEIYIGHTATRNHLPQQSLNLWNLDTGSGWHGKLTIMDIDTKEYWQSDFSNVLYPGERGRG